MKKKKNKLNPKCGYHLTETIKHFESLFDLIWLLFFKNIVCRGRDREKQEQNIDKKVDIEMFVAVLFKWAIFIANQ